MVKVWPVILSGGSGTRLWPKSRTLFPKQFHALTSELSLLQEALARVNDPTIYGKPMVVCGEDHRFIVSEQAREMDIELLEIVLEPEGRNTAPAVAAAAAIIQKIDPNGIVLILASDHHIGDPVAFSNAVRLGAPAAADGYICTFGISPTCPETGYGYIKRTSQAIAAGVFKIDQFKEKPDLETAKRYIADPTFAWNAGLFLFSVGKMQQELNQHEPSIWPACEEAIETSTRDLIHASCGFLRLGKEAFSKAKAMSLDYAIMERTDFAAVIPLDAAWTDVGSWPSLYQTCFNKKMGTEEEIEKGLFVQGAVSHIDTTNCYLRSDGPHLATIGLKDLCVVAMDDAVLVLPMDRAQDVGTIAKALRRDPNTEFIATSHVSEYKRFGAVQSLARGDNYRVVMVTIKPGSATSKQMHFHRAMHQVVVRGTACVEQGGKVLLLHENQSTYIPIGTTHRLHNPGKVPLVIMEVQSGSYIGDDDIVRLEDPCESERDNILDALKTQPLSDGPINFSRPSSPRLAPGAGAATPAPPLSLANPVSASSSSSSSSSAPAHAECGGQGQGHAHSAPPISGLGAVATMGLVYLSAMALGAGIALAVVANRGKQTHSSHFLIT